MFLKAFILNVNKCMKPFFLEEHNRYCKSKLFVELYLSYHRGQAALKKTITQKVAESKNQSNAFQQINYSQNTRTY